MHHIARCRSLSLWGPVALLTSLSMWCGPASAQLFGDDEARKAIIELRGRVEVDRRAVDAQIQRISQDLARQNEENTAPTRRGLLDLSNQIEAVRADQARMRGQSEQLARDVAELQRQQKDVLAALNDRLRQLEPVAITLDGQTFRAKPEEKAEFDQAMESVRKAEFAQAVTAFSGLLKRFPDSGYRPAALFWLGNAQYANSAFREAIESYRSLLSLSPDHARAPEARLAIANCQMELKDTKAAKRTLDEVVKLHPQSEAAATAKDRLSRMR